MVTTAGAPNTGRRAARRRAVTRARRVLVVVAVVGMLVTGLAAGPSTAQTAAVQLSTPYPAVAVEAGDSVAFDLAVVAPSPQRVDLAVTALPEGWTASLRGGGFSVDGVFAAADPEVTPDLELEVEVPGEATEGVYEVAVTATGAAGADTLALAIRVAEAVAGGVSLEADFPTLAGPADTDFTFDLTLTNDTPDEISFNLSAAGPEGWQVTARPSAEERAVTATVEGGESERIRVEATPPEEVEAGVYPLRVRATGGGHTLVVDLGVEITGAVELNLTTPDERLNLEALAGRPAELTLTLANTGSAPLTDVRLSASPPRDWEVTFAPETVPELPPGESTEVIATVTPADEAVAGDYIVTLTASAAESSSAVDIRTTVQTSRAWGLVGIGLILGAFGGLAGVFRRFGRR